MNSMIPAQFRDEQEIRAICSLLSAAELAFEDLANSAAFRAAADPDSFDFDDLLGRLHQHREAPQPLIPLDIPGGRELRTRALDRARLRIAICDTVLELLPLLTDRQIDLLRDHARAALRRVAPAIHFPLAHRLHHVAA